MAKKKIITTTEEEIEEPQEINYVEDLKDKSIEQIATDEVVEEIKKIEEPEVVEEVKEEEEVIDFDPQKLKEEAIEEAEKRLLDKLKGSTPEETKENKDEYQEWAENFAQTHGGKAPEWKDAFVWMEERAVNKLEERQTAKQQETQKQQDEAIQAEKTQLETVNTYVDQQLDDLYNSGKFPRIQNKDNPNDTGIVTRKALFEQTMLVNKARLDKGLPTKTLKEVFYEDFKAPTKQPAGADAPVSAGRGGGATGNEEEINYIKDVRNARSFVDILTRRG